MLLNPYAVEARYGTIDPTGLDRQFAVRIMQEMIGQRGAY